MTPLMFFFPYSGASGMTFQNWAKLFAPVIDCRVMEYPGRGERIEEDFYPDVQTAASDLYQTVKSDVLGNDPGKSPSPYYLCGHCLGALIVYELYFLIRDRSEFPLPEAVLLSGQGAPDQPQDGGMSSMEDRKLLEYIYSQGRLDREMLDPQMMRFVRELILEPLKSDSALCVHYQSEHAAVRDKIEVPLHLFFGSDDDIYGQSLVRRWTEFSDGVDFTGFKGTHYFLLDSAQEYVAQAKGRLLRAGNGSEQAAGSE